MSMLIATYIHMNFMKLCTNINAYTYVYTYMITLQFSCLGINSWIGDNQKWQSTTLRGEFRLSKCFKVEAKQIWRPGNKTEIYFN